MKQLQILYSILLIGMIVVLSCKKDYSSEGNISFPTHPFANAGPDINIYLPTDSCTLNGSLSYDPNSNILVYQWTKIAGPSAVIKNANAVTTQVTNLTYGMYQFELSVTENNGIKSKDTVEVNVYLPNNFSGTIEGRPRINARITAIGNLSVARIPYVGAAGSKIVFAGGFYYTGPNYYAVSSAADIYDINTHEWTTVQLSRAREGIAVVSCGNKIFFAGGGFFDIAWDNVDIYDASTNTWTMAHLSEPRTFMAAASLGNKIYFAGGYTNTLEGVSKTVDIYDLSTSSWSSIEMPKPRAELTAVAVGTKIYFAGGNRIDPSYIDIYDAVTNNWSATSLQEFSGVISGIAKDEKIFWAGEENGANGIAGKAQIFNTTNYTATINYLSYSRYAPSLVVKNNDVVFFSQPIGYMGGDLGPMANQFDIFNTASGLWSIGMLPFSIAFQSVIQANNIIYFGGGKTGTYTCTSKVYKVEW